MSAILVSLPLLHPPPHSIPLPLIRGIEARAIIKVKLPPRPDVYGDTHANLPLRMRRGVEHLQANQKANTDAPCCCCVIIRVRRSWGLGWPSLISDIQKRGRVEEPFSVLQAV